MFKLRNIDIKIAVTNNMSTYTPQSSTPLTLQATKDSQAYGYVIFAALTLIIYDTILTAPRSIEYLRTRRVIYVVPVLYACAQFGTMGSLVFSAFQSPSISTSACNGLSFLQFLFFGFAAIGIQGLLFGRAYAVAPHNKKSLILLGLIYMVNVGTAFGFFKWWMCNDSYLEGNSFSTLSIIGEASLVAFDIGVLVITLYHAWVVHGASRVFRVSWRPQAQATGIGEQTPESLTTLFIRQGIFRFMLIAAWSTADICAYKFVRSTITGVDEPLEMAISPIMLGRFLFQLRKTCYAESEEPSNQTELSMFRAVVQNVETSIRMELGENDMPETDHIGHPSSGVASVEWSHQQDLESHGNYTGEDNNGSIRRTPEEPLSSS